MGVNDKAPMMRKKYRQFELVAGAILCALLMATACGGRNQAPRVAPPPEPLTPQRFLLEYGLKQLEVLHEPTDELEALQKAARKAKGEERPQANFDVALKHLHLGEAAESEEDAQRSFRKAFQQATRGGRGVEDEGLSANFAFVRLWGAWREGRKAAPSLARQFLRDHDDAGEMTRLAWAVRGEVELGNEGWSEAVDAFRNLIGDSQDPLYAYSLFRIGVAYKNAGKASNASRSFRQVRDYGCNDDAPEEVLYIARLASAEVETPVHIGPSGRPVPSTCLAEPSDEK